MSRQMRFAIHRLCLIATLLFSTIGCDQLSKIVARDTLPTIGPRTYFNNTLVLTHAENPGAFLNLGATLTETQRALIFTWLVGTFVLGLLVFVLVSRRLSKWTTIALTLIAAGGLGNLIDRAHKGSVTDFINVGIGSLRTGIFNIADMAIMLGIAIIFCMQWYEQKFQRVTSTTIK